MVRRHRRECLMQTPILGSIAVDTVTAGDQENHHHMSSSFTSSCHNLEVPTCLAVNLLPRPSPSICSWCYGVGYAPLHLGRTWRGVPLGVVLFVLGVPKTATTPAAVAAKSTSSADPDRHLSYLDLLEPTLMTASAATPRDASKYAPPQ